MVNSLCHISKTRWLAKSKGNLKEPEKQQLTEVYSKIFLSKELHNIWSPAVFYCLIRLSDIMKVHPEWQFFIHVMLLARKWKKQIMVKEDQLNPFQLNCAGELGRKWYWTKIYENFSLFIKPLLNSKYLLKIALYYWCC